MKVKRIFAPDMRQAMRRVRDEIGPDAVIISNHRVAGGVEVVAAREQEYELAQAELKRSRQQSQRKSSVARSEPSRNEELEAELRRAQFRIAEVRERSEQPQPSVDMNANRQMDDDESEDLRFILDSLKERQKERNKESSRQPRVGLDHEVSSGERAASAAGQESQQMMMSMQQEIHQLRALLERQMVQPSASKVADQPAFDNAQAARIGGRLEQMGLGRRLVQQIMTGIEPDLPVDKAWRNSLGKLAEAIPVVGEEFIARGGMVVFVGPTGVGKTTTIGKLAARYVLQHGSSSLALVTTDCYRIAAHEQLRTFGRILDVPVRVVDENHNLEEVLTSLRGKRLVLIDTAGMNARDPAGQQQMESLASVSMRLKKLLVLSCSSQRQLLESAYENYKELGLNGCVLSKMDESGSLGEALTVAIEKQLPVAYVTDGQRIPDDIVVAQRRDLVSRAVVTSQRDNERSRDSDEDGRFFQAG
ncbi:flagellar biosynthesis protein FlhF [Nitrincola alkalilacustris]|uniref:flagellar biosynthesis protein FlhF n=1 Tax=Nitrincola alkalilacustris TaxID=1571224 RepID=UPI00124BE19B|nr:flagellar biosynthesis protein FlhF [Nitrincola alkalilacustris]